MPRLCRADRLLDGVRILDFTVNAAGPYGVWLLGTLGAEVIKVEARTRPDPSRGLIDRPYAHSNFYEDVNCGKRCVELDLKDPAGAEAALALAASCDAIIDSFRPGVMKRLGIGPDELLARNPSAVVASLSATGSSGPMAGLPGYAGVFNALGGLGGLTGYRGGPPTELRTSVDLRCGATLAMLVSWALRDAAQTGRGRWIDFSAMEAVAMLVGEYLTAARLGASGIVQRIGNRDELWAPQGVYPARDGSWVALSVRSDSEWRALAGLLGLTSNDLDCVEERHRRADEVDELIASWTAMRDQDAVVELLQQASIPAEQVLGAEQVANDPLLVNSGFYQRVEGADDAGVCIVASPPWLVDGDRAQLKEAHSLGADTDAVFAELAAAPRGAASPSADLPKADRSLRVAELATGVAAPFAGRMFANLGAEVMKVEIAAGDWTRQRPPLVKVDDTTAGALFHFLNAGKRGVVWESPEPSAADLDAVWAWADVVLVDENFLEIEPVRARLADPGPSVVTCVTPFGANSASSRQGTAATIFARCGETSITPAGLGYKLFPDAPPLVARGKVADIDAGVMAVLVTTAALHGGTQPGDPPTHVDVSIYETEVSNNRWIPGNQIRTGWVETRASKPYPFGGLMPCKDGYSMFLPSTDRIWQAFIDVMERPSWSLDPELLTREGRVANADRVKVLITDWAQTMEKDELLRRGLAHGVPIGPYRDVDEVAECQQLEHRGFYVDYGTDGASIAGVPAAGLTRDRRLCVAPKLDR